MGLKQWVTTCTTRKTNLGKFCELCLNQRYMETSKRKMKKKRCLLVSAKKNKNFLTFLSIPKFFLIVLLGNSVVDFLAASHEKLVVELFARTFWKIRRKTSNFSILLHFWAKNASFEKILQSIQIFQPKTWYI